MSMRLSVPIGRVRLTAILALAVLAGSLAAATATIAQDCEEELARAQQSYDIGRFDEAIETLRFCLDQNEPDLETQARAYRLIGMAYIGSRKEAEAKQAIVELLEIAPGYEPTPEDNRNYVDLVYEVRMERDPDYTPPSAETEEKKGFLNKYVIGAGVAVVGVVAWLISDGDDPPPPPDELPDPPALPSK